ncbi:MAG: lipopolysaccharide heptosyltransferase II [Candidatus Omnitrophica bacterium]|nr:lipopolysaccharide heptosyltransferase II [Candidatus Omnitrophota bacterium]
MFPRRILVIRLDRIGDVVLSTPVAHRLRQAYPEAFLAMLVQPACRELVEGHPDLDAAILYDKDGRHRSLTATIQFARQLRSYRFDTAIVLHPTNRSHWIPWLAGIPVRIGYARKTSWLLTHRVPHRKQEGTQHEAAYSLELLRVLGIEPGPPVPVIALSPAARVLAEERLAQAGADPARPLVAIHPSASCRSKRWEAERFAAVADRLATEQGAQVAIVAGPADQESADAMARAMRTTPINLAGRLSVGELAWVLKRATLLLSNDSGPVHVAAAVGTPVIVIFGRNERGLSPTRWGPLGKGHVVLHKEVGCEVCLAHRCVIAFKCLTELSREEVYQAAAEVLRRRA